MVTKRSIRSALAGACAGGAGLAALIAVPHADVGRWRPVDALLATPSLATPSAAASDSLPHDPALTMGTLPNGMHYYIRVNHTPAKRAMLRLVVNAGSILEDEDQRGFAHFLEHMAFNGTAHFPRHELLDYLQTAGMRFGADINAYTSYDETVYMLEVPTDDGKSLAQGLSMVHDWAAGGMRIDSSEVLAERGVVLGEWRSRLADTLSQRVQAHQDSVLYGPDSHYLARYTIGLPKLLEAAQPEPIRRFYHDWYRPDLMAVVAVGDFDPKQVVREITAHFGNIPAAQHPKPRDVQPPPTSPAPVVDVFRAPVSPSVLAVWREPPQPVATKTALRAQFVDQLLFEAVQRRFLALREREHRPFFDARVARFGLVRPVQGYALQVVAQPDSLETGLAAALTELERVAQHGVSAPALEQQKSALLTRLQGDVAAAAAQPSGGYATAYATHYLEGDATGLPSAAQTLALAQALVPTITSTDLAQAAAFWRRRKNLVLQYNQFQWAHVRTPTRESLLALFDSVAHEQLAPDSVATASDAPLLATLPTPGRIVRETRNAGAGITEWTLSNGARVFFKPTTNNADELLIHAASPGGSALLPDTLFFSSGRMVAAMMTEAAGFGGGEHTRLEQQMASTGLLREFEVTLTPTDEGIRLGGSPRNLESLFQLLYRQFTAPPLDTAALAIWKRVGTPATSYSLDDQIAGLLSRGNPRLMPASWALMPFANLDKAMAVYRDRFGNAGDFTFTIVGTARPEQVRPLVERYLASLPSTGKKEQAKDLGVRPWNHIQRATNRVFDIPKASTLLFFEGAFPSAPEAYLTERRRLDALSWTLQLEFTDKLREQMGGTYGIGVQAWTKAEPQEHYRFAINFDAAPERMEGMLDTTFQILATVRARGATPDELRKIAAMQRRGWETSLQNNHFWVTAIEQYDRLNIPFDQIVHPPHAPLTASDIRAAAQTYLPTTAFINITSLPRDTLFDVAHDSTSHASSHFAGW